MMVNGLPFTFKSSPVAGLLMKAQPQDSETVQSLSFGEVLKAKEKQLQQELEIHEGSATFGRSKPSSGALSMSAVSFGYTTDYLVDIPGQLSPLPLTVAPETSTESTAFAVSPALELPTVDTPGRATGGNNVPDSQTSQQIAADTKTLTKFRKPEPLTVKDLEVGRQTTQSDIRLKAAQSSVSRRVSQTRPPETSDPSGARSTETSNPQADPIPMEVQARQIAAPFTVNKIDVAERSPEPASTDREKVAVESGREIGEKAVQEISLHRSAIMGSAADLSGTKPAAPLFSLDAVSVSDSDADLTRQAIRPQPTNRGAAATPELTDAKPLGFQTVARQNQPAMETKPDNFPSNSPVSKPAVQHEAVTDRPDSYIPRGTHSQKQHSPSSDSAVRMGASNLVADSFETGASFSRSNSIGDIQPSTEQTGEKSGLPLHTVVTADKHLPEEISAVFSRPQDDGYESPTAQMPSFQAIDASPLVVENPPSSNQPGKELPTTELKTKETASNGAGMSQLDKEFTREIGAPITDVTAAKVVLGGETSAAPVNSEATEVEDPTKAGAIHPAPANDSDAAREDLDIHADNGLPDVLAQKSAREEKGLQPADQQISLLTRNHEFRSDPGLDLDGNTTPSSSRPLDMMDEKGNTNVTQTRMERPASVPVSGNQLADHEAKNVVGANAEEAFSEAAKPATANTQLAADTETPKSDSVPEPRSSGEPKQEKPETAVTSQSSIPSSVRVTQNGPSKPGDVKAENRAGETRTANIQNNHTTPDREIKRPGAETSVPVNNSSKLPEQEFQLPTVISTVDVSIAPDQPEAEGSPTLYEIEPESPLSETSVSHKRIPSETVPQPATFETSQAGSTVAVKTFPQSDVDPGTESQIASAGIQEGSSRTRQTVLTDTLSSKVQAPLENRAAFAETPATSTHKVIDTEAETVQRETVQTSVAPATLDMDLPEALPSQPGTSPESPDVELKEGEAFHGDNKVNVEVSLPERGSQITANAELILEHENETQSDSPQVIAKTTSTNTSLEPTDVEALPHNPGRVLEQFHTDAEPVRAPGNTLEAMSQDLTPDPDFTRVAESFSTSGNENHVQAARSQLISSGQATQESVDPNVDVESLQSGTEQKSLKTDSMKFKVPAGTAEPQYRETQSSKSGYGMETSVPNSDGLHSADLIPASNAVHEFNDIARQPEVQTPATPEDVKVESGRSEKQLGASEHKAVETQVHRVDVAVKSVEILFGITAQPPSDTSINRGSEIVTSQPAAERVATENSDLSKVKAFQVELEPDKPVTHSQDLINPSGFQNPENPSQQFTPDLSRTSSSESVGTKTLRHQASVADHGTDTVTIKSDASEALLPRTNVELSPVHSEKIEDEVFLKAAIARDPMPSSEQTPVSVGANASNADPSQGEVRPETFVMTPESTETKLTSEPSNVHGFDITLDLNLRSSRENTASLDTRPELEPQQAAFERDMKTIKGEASVPASLLDQQQAIASAFTDASTKTDAGLQDLKVNQTSSVEKKDDPAENQFESNETLDATGGIASSIKQGSAVGSLEAGSFVQAESHAVEIVEQVFHKLNGRLKSGPTSMHLKLNPDSLGPIDVEVVRDAQGVSVTFFAEQAGTGKLLETQLGQLRQSLVDSGVQLSSLNIGQNSYSGQEGGFRHQTTSFAHHPQGETFQSRNHPEERAPAKQVTGQTSEVDYLI